MCVASARFVDSHTFDKNYIIVTSLTCKVIPMVRRCFTQQAAYWYRLITADPAAVSDPSICFAVTSRVLPPKDKKSIRERET
jgi:hypothetical protein